MSSQIIELLILAGIVVFMVLRLKNALGTRDGFEGPSSRPGPESSSRPQLEVVEGTADQDIADHVDPESETGQALARMKRVENQFEVNEFVEGARGAYEWILMSFEKGEMEDLRPFLSTDVFDAFSGVVEARAEQGLTVEAEFIGVREVTLVSATYVDDTRTATIDMKFVGEMTSVVRNSNGDIVEGNEREIKRQKDVWTFSRKMGSEDPNWQLVATGE